MRLKLLKPVYTQDNQEIEYIYFKKPTMRDLTHKSNIGLFDSFLGKFLRATEKIQIENNNKENILQEEASKKIDETKLLESISLKKQEDKTEEEILLEKELTDKKLLEEIEQEKSAIDTVKITIRQVLLSGYYNEIIEDMTNRASCYLNKFLFIDEELNNSILNNNIILKQLDSNDELYDLHCGICYFFLMATLPTKPRKLEI